MHYASLEPPGKRLDGIRADDDDLRESRSNRKESSSTPPVQRGCEVPRPEGPPIPPVNPTAAPRTQGPPDKSEMMMEEDEVPMYALFDDNASYESDMEDLGFDDDHLTNDRENHGLEDNRTSNASSSVPEDDDNHTSNAASSSSPKPAPVTRDVSLRKSARKMARDEMHHTETANKKRIIERKSSVATLEPIGEKGRVLTFSVASRKQTVPVSSSAGLSKKKNSKKGTDLPSQTADPWTVVVLPSKVQDEVESPVS